MEHQYKRPMPIADYLASRQGHVWTEADTEEVMRIFREVDRLAESLVAKAREEADERLGRVHPVMVKIPPVNWG